MPQKYKTNLPILYVSCDTPEHVPYNQIHISGVSDSYYAKKTTSYNVEARFSSTCYNYITSWKCYIYMIE